MPLICVMPQSSELWKIPKEFPINRTGGKWRACSYELEQLCFFNWIPGGSLERKPCWALVLHACWSVWSAPTCPFKGLSLKPVLAFELFCIPGACSAPWLQSELNTKEVNRSITALRIWVSLFGSCWWYALLCVADQLQNQVPNTSLKINAWKDRRFPRGKVNSILKES